MVSVELLCCIVFIVMMYNCLDVLVCVLVGCGVQIDYVFDVVVVDDGLCDDICVVVEVVVKIVLYLLCYVWYFDDGFCVGEICNCGVLVIDVDYFVFFDGDCVLCLDFVVWYCVLVEWGCLLFGSCIFLNEVMMCEVVVQQIDIYLKDCVYWFVVWCVCCINKFLLLLVLGLLVFCIFKDISLCGIKSCNFGVWCSDFECVNGFDQSFVGWGYEDVDLVVCLYNVGVWCKCGFCVIEVFYLWYCE